MGPHSITVVVVDSQLTRTRSPGEVASFVEYLTFFCFMKTPFPPLFFPGDWMLSFIPPLQATGIAPLQILTVSEVTALVGIWLAYTYNHLRVGAVVVYGSFIVARYRVLGKSALEKCPESLANTHTPATSSAFSRIHRGGILYRSQLAGCDVQVRM